MTSYFKIKFRKSTFLILIWLRSVGFLILHISVVFSIWIYGETSYEIIEIMNYDVIRNTHFCKKLSNRFRIFQRIQISNNFNVMHRFWWVIFTNKKCSYHGRIPVLCGLKQKNIRILKILDFVLNCFEENNCHHEILWVHFSHNRC
jgi:hypothetical protein